MTLYIRGATAPSSSGGLPQVVFAPATLDDIKREVFNSHGLYTIADSTLNNIEVAGRNAKDARVVPVLPSSS